MIKAANEADQILIAKAYRAEQEQIFQFWEQLDDNQRCKLLQQIRDIDFQLLARLVQKQVRGSSARIVIRKTAPPSTVTRDDPDGADATVEGEEALRAGKLALVLVAGGQAARLNSDEPKGMFPIGPVSERSLFELHAAKIVAAKQRYRCELPLFVMVSEHNAEVTQRFFESHDYFGLSRTEVFFFTQLKLPSVDQRGKILLTAEDSIEFNPNGQGGLFEALARHGHLDEMDRRGIGLVSVFGVDNPLARVVDPRFVGFHLRHRAQMSVKVIPTRAGDDMGMVVQLGDRLGVIGSDQLGEAERDATDDQGRKLYRAGNAAMHLIDAGFLRAIADRDPGLPYHAHKKPIVSVTSRRGTTQREERTGIKFEARISDALTEAERTMVYELDRDEEFAPLLNASGPDSPDTVRRAISAAYARWLEEVGCPVPRKGDGEPDIPIEIDPRFALYAEDLRAKLQPGQHLVEDGRIHLR